MEWFILLVLFETPATYYFWYFEAFAYIIVSLEGINESKNTYLYVLRFDFYCIKNAVTLSWVQNMRRLLWRMTINL